MQNAKGIKRPSTLVLSRQGMPNMDTTSVEGCLKGAYVVHGGEGTPDVIIIGGLGWAGRAAQLAAAHRHWGLSLADATCAACPEPTWRPCCPRPRL